jgi:tRNA(Ile)-lysidine synthase TilS/MesJ
VDADFTVRQGDFKAALIAAAEEHGASLIVLGRPADDSLTTLDYLENELSPAIKEATGIETIVV